VARPRKIMGPVLTTVTALAEARTLAGDLDRQAAEFRAQFSDEPYPAGAVARFLERAFAAPETVLVVARDPSGARLGVCLTGPLADPLLGTAMPTVLVLYVAPTWRHRGIAGSLIREARAALAARGLATLSARVGHNDDALISMGERWGFVRHWELMLRE